MDKETFANISTISAILPILIGSMAVRYNRVITLFWIFIIYGFFTDIIGALSNDDDLSMLPLSFGRFIQNVYSLVDCLFLIYFLWAIQPTPTISSILKTLLILATPAWFVAYMWLGDVWSIGNAMNAYFDTIYNVIVAFGSAYMLLLKTQPGNNILQSQLWLLIGVFFFSFCTFFISNFIDSEIAQKIWYMMNLTNIITMMIYSYAFLLARKEKAHMKVSL